MADNDDNANSGGQISPHEPTMEEILASIRRIISEDDDPQPDRNDNRAPLFKNDPPSQPQRDNTILDGVSGQDLFEHRRNEYFQRKTDFEETDEVPWEVWIASLPLTKRATSLLEHARGLSLGGGINPAGLLKGIIYEGLRKSGSRFSRWFVQALVSKGVARALLDQWIHSSLDSYRDGYDGTESIRQLLGQAQSLSLATRDRPGIDDIHLVAVFLVTENNEATRPALTEFRRLTGIDLPALGPDFAENLPKLVRDEEERSAWHHIFEIKRSLSLASFTSDEAVSFDGPLEGASDPLSVHADVFALARVIALKAAKPPLSVALFGQWGSGKSTFMSKLEAAIQSLSTIGRRNAASPFAANIVHIRFNAWHYADANLWASLTSEFFQQLKAGGAKAKNAAVYENLVATVTQHVQGLSSTVSLNGTELAKGETKLLEAQRARDAQAKAAAQTAGAAFSQFLIDTVSQAYRDNKSEIERLGVSYGHTDTTDDIDAFLEIVKKSKTGWGRGALLWKSICARPLTSWALGLGILCALAGFFISLLNKEQFLGLFTLWGVLPGSAFVLAAISPGAKVISGILKKTQDFSDHLGELKTESTRKLIAAETALNDVAREVSAQRQAFHKAEAALAPFSAPDAPIGASHILRYILDDHLEAESFDRETGVINRSRRFFEKLDQTVKAERSKPTLGTTVPDRIVLYIDDLDRCAEDNVYAVLQAIHLLLSFELFVVVVGVDIRWVQRAIIAHQAKHLGEHETGGMSGETVKQGYATEYLEKIFQIPFWIRPLDPGSTYTTYVTNLLSPNIASAEVAEVDEFVEGLQAVSQQMRDGTPVSPSEPKSSTYVDSEPETLVMTLSSQEIAFLSSPEIGMIAGKNPRAVKRMVNIYRLIRAHFDPFTLRRFLGSDGGRPGFVPAAILIALEVGQSAEVVHGFYSGITAVVREDAEAILSIALSLLDATQGVPAISFEKKSPLKGKISSTLSGHLSAALEAAIELTDGQAITVQDFLDQAKHTTRYSFYGAPAGMSFGS